MLDQMAMGLIASLGPSAVFAAAAVLLWFYLLRWLDRRGQQEGAFKDAMDTLKKNELAYGLYLGLRALAVAHLVSNVLATVRF